MSRTVTFLVLDDDADMRFLHRRELQREFPGCTVVECATTAEALTRSADICLDAVLTDHSLCGDDGAVFIARLREQGMDCPVIMVTGSGDPKVHEGAYAAGATKVFFGTKLGFASYLRSILERTGTLVPFGKAQGRAGL